MFNVFIFILGGFLITYSMLAPLPYGRFSDKLSILPIPATLARVLRNVPALIALLVYYFNNRKLTGSGGMLLIFLAVYFTWRTISPLLLNSLHQDTKSVSFLFVLFFATYNTFVGLQLGYACSQLTEMNTYDIPLIVLASIFFGLHVFYDIDLNRMRRTRPDGYIPESELEAKYKMLFMWGISSPNYFFEVLQWIALTVISIDIVVYLFITIALLWLRACHMSLWYSANN